MTTDTAKTLYRVTSRITGEHYGDVWAANQDAAAAEFRAMHEALDVQPAPEPEPREWAICNDKTPNYATVQEVHASREVAHGRLLHLGERRLDLVMVSSAPGTFEVGRRVRWRQFA